MKEKILTNTMLAEVARLGLQGKPLTADEIEVTRERYHSGKESQHHYSDCGQGVWFCCEKLMNEVLSSFCDLYMTHDLPDGGVLFKEIDDYISAKVFEKLGWYIDAETMNNLGEIFMKGIETYESLEELEEEMSYYCEPYAVLENKDGTFFWVPVETIEQANKLVDAGWTIEADSIEGVAF